MVKLFYTTYISVDLANQVIFHAKVGKGGINAQNLSQWTANRFILFLIMYVLPFNWLKCMGTQS